MPKRKLVAASDEEEEEALHTDASDDKELPKAKARAKKQQTIKKPTSFRRTQQESSAEEDDEPSAQKSKPASKGKALSQDKASSQDKANVLTDSSGDKYIDLGKRKRATVRSFKGAAFVDIREFYDAGGEEKPGKKGIALQAEQWETLKANAHVIDELFATVKKK